MIVNYSILVKHHIVNHHSISVGATLDCDYHNNEKEN
jgi:hypothetical protein